MHPRAKRLVGTSLVNDSDLEGLRSAWSAGHLVPFVGAGLSLAYGVPSWKQLVLELLVEQGSRRRALRDHGPHLQRALAGWLTDYLEYDPVILARVVKQALRHSARQRGEAAADRAFLETVRRQIYPDGPAAPREGTGLAALADLIASGRRGQVSAVVNFNFDDLLEAELAVRRVEHYSVWGEHRTPGKGIPIIHPHGFLPRAGPLEDHHIVFTEDEYHRVGERPFYWATTELVSQLRKNTAVFLGLSMSDPNLRQLLDVSYNADYPAHWLVQRRHAADGPALSRACEDVAERARQLERQAGGRPTNGRQELSAVLPGVLRLADTYDRELFSAMGVKTLWLETFNDLPALISEVGTRRRRRRSGSKGRVVLESADTQKGQWGRTAERNHRRLEAEAVLERDGWVRIHLAVRSTRPARHPLRGKVTFHLHDAFPEPIRVATARGGVAQVDVWGSMPFTVGAEADGGSTRLELDLSTLW
jgi:hypothetical protein